MSLSFKKWVETEDPVAAWKAMRANAGWSSDTHAMPGGDVKPLEKTVQLNPPSTSSKPTSNIPQPIVDLLQNGFRTGGTVPDQLVRFLDLGGRNRSFAADSIMHVRGFAYPFYREKKAGQPTGRFMFVQGFPIDRLLRELS
jgi:hypothetical protein